ncbi:MAG: hypothetical protein PHU25_12210, partial [Deltaproteobacteria bacterium]|nr:hypothetical protein [Deltaproteobacteria bacterium]
MDAGTDTTTQTDDSTDSTDNGCADGTEKIYLVDHTGYLWSFLPPDKKFVNVGKVKCPGTTQPYSMSVARDGTIYMVFANGLNCEGLFKISSKDASCIEKTAFTCGDNGFGTF